jgi:hypothetical protein
MVGAWRSGAEPYLGRWLRLAELRFRVLGLVFQGFWQKSHKYQRHFFVLGNKRADRLAVLGRALAREVFGEGRFNMGCWAENGQTPDELLFETTLASEEELAAPNALLLADLFAEGQGAERDLTFDYWPDEHLPPLQEQVEKGRRWGLHLVPGDAALRKVQKQVYRSLRSARWHSGKGWRVACRKLETRWAHSDLKVRQVRRSRRTA